MFINQKDPKKLAEILDEIRAKFTCCYSHPNFPPAPFCDCKYGADKIGNRGESGNGCPELRTIIGLLNNITQEEFEEILFRGQKNINVDKLEDAQKY